MTSRLPALVFAAAVVVACGGGSGPATVTPTLGPSDPASGGPSPSASSALVLPHDDPDLEAELPDEAGGVTLRKISVGPISSVGNVGAEPIRALAEEIGDGTGNFSLAFADDPASPTFNLFALRIPGAATADLTEEYSALTVRDTPGSTTDQVSIGGKTLVQVISPGNPIGDVWFYAIGDTLFGVQAGSEAAATELIALLP